MRLQHDTHNYICGLQLDLQDLAEARDSGVRVRFQVHAEAGQTHLRKNASLQRRRRALERWAGEQGFLHRHQVVRLPCLNFPLPAPGPADSGADSVGRHRVAGPASGAAGSAGRPAPGDLEGVGAGFCLRAVAGQAGLLAALQAPRKTLTWKRLRCRQRGVGKERG